MTSLKAKNCALNKTDACSPGSACGWLREVFVLMALAAGKDTSLRRPLMRLPDDGDAEQADNSLCIYVPRLAEPLAVSKEEHKYRSF